MVNNIIEIKEFWNWFALNKDQFIPSKITNEFISQLDNKILSMGDFSWEIREGISKNYMLIISPGGDINLLSRTKEIISFSPDLEDWEFFHYKPEKKWDFKLSLYEEDKVQKIVDVSDWEYVLYKFPDGSFDIIFRAENLINSSDDEKIVIAEIVLESILGEELSLEYIKNIEVLLEFDDVDMQKKSSIKFLKDHFTELI